MLISVPAVCNSVIYRLVYKVYRGVIHIDRWFNIYRKGLNSVSTKEPPPKNVSYQSVEETARDCMILMAQPGWLFFVGLEDCFNCSPSPSGIVTVIFVF